MKAASGSSATGSDVEELPLVDCPDCGKHVIKLRSKQAATYGRVFYKCEENVKVSWIKSMLGFRCSWPRLCLILLISLTLVG